MPEADALPAASFALVRAEWRFTEAELLAYWRISRNRSTGNQPPFDGEWTVRIIAVVTSLAAHFASFALGVINDPRNPTVAIFCLLGIYIVLTSQEWLVKRYWARRRSETAGRQIDLDRTFLMDERGVVFERAYAMHKLEWPAIQQVTSADGLMLFWTEEKDAAAVPIRATAEADRLRAFEMAKTRGTVRAGSSH